MKWTHFPFYLAISRPNLEVEMEGSRKPSLPDQREAILQLFANDRHVLIGHVAMGFKCSLSEAEAYLDKLCEEKVLRVMTPQEARTRGVRHGYLKV